MIISYKYRAYPDAVTEAELNAARIAPIPPPPQQQIPDRLPAHASCG